MVCPGDHVAGFCIEPLAQIQTKNRRRECVGYIASFRGGRRTGPNLYVGVVRVAGVGHDPTTSGL